MDLQTASRSVGWGGRIARMAALVCFVLACGILIVSHARPSKASFYGSNSQRPPIFAAR